jgi:predicted MFS family arabinose efflux permease
VALVGSFVAIEARHPHPLIRLGILRVRSLAGADAAMLLVASGMFGMFFFASLYVQDVMHYSPLRAGLAFLPVTAGIIAGAGASQQLIRRLGVRAVGIFGMALAAVGLLVLSRIPVNGSYLADLLPGLMMMALGMGLTFVPITLIATTNVDENDAGLASGLINTAQQVGGALGLAILATLSAGRTTGLLGSLGHAPSAGDRVSALVSGFQLAFLVAAVMIGSGSVLLAAVVRRRHVELIDLESAQPALAA